jgi:hypothetical protein
MSKIRDAWFVRLPGGQEIRAKSTAAVIHHFANGNIPRESRARRSRDEWMLLEWHAEFTDAVTGVAQAREAPADRPAAAPSPPVSGVAARLDPMRLRTVGVRALWEDLIAAVDCTFVRDKLAVAAAGSAVVGLIWGGVPWLLVHVFALQLTLDAADREWWQRLLLPLDLFLGIIVLALVNGLLSRMTHIELSTLRRAGWQESLRGYSTSGFRLTLAYLLAAGGALLLMGALHWLPGAFIARAPEWGLSPIAERVAAALISALALVVEMLLWLLIGLTWLLAPPLVAEELPFAVGVREWWRMIRDHFNRIVLAELLTLALGALIAVPIAVPVYFAISSYPQLPLPLRTLAYGIASAGFVAFMAVANVFIYLDVKYEQN